MPLQDKIPPVDPTRNVLDLVAAESRYRDAMRVADEKLQSAENRLLAYRTDAVEKQQEIRHQLSVVARDAEMRRQNDLARMKEGFDHIQAEILRMQVKDNAALLSNQLDKMQTVLSERIAKLEQFRYESSGRGLGINAVIGYLLAAAGLAIAIGVAIWKN